MIEQYQAVSWYNVYTNFYHYKSRQNKPKQILTMLKNYTLLSPVCQSQKVCYGRIIEKLIEFYYKNLNYILCVNKFT